MDSRWHHQYQMVPNNSQNFDPNIYRSSMALVPSLNGTVYGAQVNSDLQIRPKTRDLVRSRTIDCHAPTIPSVETTPILQRTPSRQTNAHHQMIPDPMDQAEGDTTVSTTHSTSRSLEQQQQNSNHNKYPWNHESRKPTSTNDNYMISSNGHNSSFGRLFNSPSKNDFTSMNKIIMTQQRESNYDLTRPARSSKQNTNALPKTPIDSNRRQVSNNHLFGVYPCARTAILHVTNAIMPTSRQQSIRLPSTKSRHHDR